VPLILALVWFFETERRQANVRRANEVVAAKVEGAKDRLARRQWDKAIGTLQEALATDEATEFGNAPEMLRQAQRDRAEACFAAAVAALEQNKHDQAMRLLSQYAADEHGAKTVEARRLVDEIDLATSDARARELLKTVKQSGLIQFDQTGELAEMDRVSKHLRPVFAETLRRNVLDELKRRAVEEINLEARLEAERQARDVEARNQAAIRQRLRVKTLPRIQATPVFRELTEFVALMRQQDRVQRGQLEQVDKEFIDALFGRGASGEAPAPQLDVGDTRAKKREYSAWQTSLLEKISVNRANYKERFRSYPDFEEAERDIFDEEIDKTLDELANEVKKPLDDTLAEGLRALSGK
jgi:hypothetical protein